MAKATPKKPASSKKSASDPPTAIASPIPNASSSSEAISKLSAVQAAFQILGITGKAMSCPELIAAMAEQKLWSSPKGQTPASTLHAAIMREINAKGDRSRFQKAERGKFTLKIEIG